VGGIDLLQVVAVYEQSKSTFKAGKARYAA
jgi:hypothetical protein